MTMIAFKYMNPFWKPPVLDTSNKLRLGCDILKVGRESFAKAYIARLMGTKDKQPFTFADIVKDAEWDNNNPPSHEKKAAAIALMATLGVVVIGTGIAPALAAPCAFSVVTSLWGMRKVNRFIDDAIDCYAKALQNGLTIDFPASPIYLKTDPNIESSEYRA